jgi:hypothetical protein
MGSIPFDARLWAVAILGLSSWAHAQCTNDCGTGDVAEGELCLIDESEDVTNGGCNSTPEVFGTIACGQTVCGIISTYDQGASNVRDTDWYRVSQAEMAAADLDGDGVVQLGATLVSEFPGVTFFITFEPDCSTLGYPGTTGYSDAGCAGGQPAVATLTVAEHPGGVVVFVSCGDGGGPIYDGYECSTGLNDYTVRLECPEPGGPVCMATGASPSVEGYLEICADAYGAWTSTSWGGKGDRFNPIGGPNDQPAAFSSGLMVFRPGFGQRELLSTDLQWQAVFNLDHSLQRQVTVPSAESDTDGDGVTDMLTSTFEVTGAGVDLTFDLQQSVTRRRRTRSPTTCPRRSASSCFACTTATWPGWATRATTRWGPMTRHRPTRSSSGRKASTPPGSR